MTSADRRYRIVFVCLGNICRSPMAELAMRRLLEGEGLDERVEVASAATGDHHVGEPADERAAATLREHSYDPDAHAAQQFLAGDGFPLVLGLVEAACRGLLEHVRVELAPAR